jgi:hypothetical protein
MAGLVPAIHVFAAAKEDVDGRDKRGHDDCWWRTRSLIRNHMRNRTAVTQGRATNKPVVWVIALAARNAGRL